MNQIAQRTCTICGKEFPYPRDLKRHRERKTPCAPIIAKEDLSELDQKKAHRCCYCGRAFTTATAMYRHVRQRCKIANSEEGMEKLFEHTLQQQVAAQSAKVDALQAQLVTQSAQMAELAALLKGGLAGAPRPAATVVENAAVVNTGPTTNNVVNQVNNINATIQIAPWDGDRRISVDAGQIAAAFAENGRLKEYAGWPDHEMVDPERASPYVTELYVDLTKRAHADPAARNVYLNPRRADQALVLVTGGKWEVLPLGETTRQLFDGITANIRRVTLTGAELKQLPMEAQNAVSMAKMMYQGEPEEYVVRAKAPMSAHLANTVPTPASALEAR